MEETIAFAWEMGIWDAIFEGDSQVVVNVLISNSVPPAQIANNISGSLSQIHQFRSVQLLNVPRSDSPVSGNKLSHALAQHARDNPEFIIWTKEIPCIVEHLVHQDVLFFILI